MPLLKAGTLLAGLPEPRFLGTSAATETEPYVPEPLGRSSRLLWRALPEAGRTLKPRKELLQFRWLLLADPALGDGLGCVKKM